MRSRTGSSAFHCSKVQNMAASESRWLVEKSDCYAKTVRQFREILLEIKLRYVSLTVKNKKDFDSVNAVLNYHK